MKSMSMLISLLYVLPILLQIYKAYPISGYAHYISIYVWLNKWSMAFSQKFYVSCYPGSF